MYITIKSAANVGLTCLPIDVEIDVTGSFPGFYIVGLPDAAIQEARPRIRAAWKNSGHTFPSTYRILVNLAPADVKKEGSAYDLPIAMGMFFAAEHIDPKKFSDSLIVGELALDGTLRHTKGILPLVLHAKERGLSSVYVPAVDAIEAGLVEGITIYPVATLKQLFLHLLGHAPIEPHIRQPIDITTRQASEYDMAYIKGQHISKRALEIAASGGHNILLSGPPGSGKTLLARTFPTILPTMSRSEAIDVTRIYSVSNLLSTTPLITERPFRSPHHSASAVSLVGGGRIPKPGEISLAHRGVLFLDEFPEFPRPVLETLRQPLEDGIVTISRAQGTITYPAQFILIASQNPCPCGFSTDPEKECVCSAAAIERYMKKISGPLLDRIDLHVEVPRVEFEKLSKTTLAESSKDIQQRVEKARAMQSARFETLSIHTNSEMKNKQIKQYCSLDEESLALMKKATAQLHLSARSYFRILKLARTIADLEQSEAIIPSHIAEALQYRSMSH